ncbi:hypothetical protein F9C07_1005389 [Aspergillus flavus]|uniref:Secreted protein n=2 Tax=Aspergillus flavus TaxID=5059 RepID=A0A7U2QWS8_ASPFN|nr:hypothetical protein BDV35DRAFT_117206 [Aspergillus flavus]QRD87162.1 hypothetical protein F9C07_1005389 [Aspergillus flavus]
MVQLNGLVIQHLLTLLSRSLPSVGGSRYYAACAQLPWSSPFQFRPLSIAFHRAPWCNTARASHRKLLFNLRTVFSGFHRLLLFRFRRAAKASEWQPTPEIADQPKGCYFLL